MTPLLNGKKLLLAGCAVIVIVVSGCSTMNKALRLAGVGSDNSLKNIVVEAAKNSNKTTAVSLDILFVIDDSVTPILLNMNGPDWFINSKAAIMKRYDKEIELLS